MKAKKLILPLLLLAVLAGVGVYMYQQRQFADDYNRVIHDLVNQGRYDEAVPELESLRERAPAGMRERVESDLVLCYLALGQDPGRSLQEGAQWLRKAQALDPGALTDDDRRQIDVAAKRGG